MSEGMSRYVVAVRAPKSGIEGMGDGSWHIVTDVQGARWVERRKALALIPYVVSAGGELVMYEIDAKARIVGGVPVLVGRSNEAFKLPEADQINAINELIAPTVHKNSREFSMPGAYRYERIENQTSLRKLQARLRKSLKGGLASTLVHNRSRYELIAGFGAAASIAVGVAIAAAFGNPSSAPRSPTYANVAIDGTRTLNEEDFDPRQLTIMRRGGAIITRPVKDQPHLMQVIRLYPRPDGTLYEEEIERFRTEHFKSSKGIVAAHTQRWLDPDQVPRKVRN